MDKDFEKWNSYKMRLDKLRYTPVFQERQVWWCSVGVNVGEEIYGKSEIFSRPVLVIRKFTHRRFLGAPLSTQVNDAPFNLFFNFAQKEQCLILSQLRVWDCRRLTTLIGQLPDNTFEKVRTAIREMV